LQLTFDGFNPFAHTLQPPAALRRIRSPVFYAHTLIPHMQNYLLGFKSQYQTCPVALRMADDVGQRFLSYAEEYGLHQWVETLALAIDL
jgi:hypothetical protein